MGECGSSLKESVPLLFSQLLGIRPFRTNKDPVPLIRIRKGRTRKPPNKKTLPYARKIRLFRIGSIESSPVFLAGQEGRINFIHQPPFFLPFLAMRPSFPPMNG
ncbi:MAG: hypothetical protein BAA03_10870 [Caldibacillus debilis]|nr:MAG: hypothetical protein BAA03_10870 [Caldibacillus debilis]